MKSLWLSTNRWLTWFHRWAGVVLCLIFAIWFASGAVLHFVGFPALPADLQRTRGGVVDLARVHIQPAAALERAPGATRLLLAAIAGRPVYLARLQDGTWLRIAADSGELLPSISPAIARDVAASFGRAPVGAVSGPIRYDQWIVHQQYDPFRPFYRVRLDDAARTDLYVSTVTGQVRQRTRLRERAWNYLGAIVHWIYFTPLRSNWSAWNEVVWWVSLAALMSAIAGTWLGIVRSVANSTAGRRGLSPFRGWMRWHHIIGLFAGAIVLTWIFSGWLSMDHGRIFSLAQASSNQTARLKGIKLAETARAARPAAMSALAPFSELTFNAIAGHPFLTAFGPAATPARIVFLDSSPSGRLTALQPSLISSALRAVWPGKTVRAADGDRYDALYRLAESVGDNGAAFLVGGNAGLRVYVDRETGRFLAVMNPNRRQYAWFYYALHTFEFPVLINHPAVRTALELALLAVGFGFSITGVILGYRRLRRQFH